MDVEILGVMRGARGPGRDLILARLHGAKPEYTGVVAGMSGSPVYISGKLLGALAYRIGQFSKEPIAGITPIEQMLEVRDLPISTETPAPGNGASPPSGENSKRNGKPVQGDSSTFPVSAQGMNFSAMETPLMMSGFAPKAIQVWKERVAGTGLDMVSAGGSEGLSGFNAADTSSPIVPGSAVSLQLVRGDMEIAATCTVTYVDPKQLLACGHPVMQSGPVSLPMTKTDVVATLASPLNAFKIVNTGRTIGAFTEDRDAAIRGVFGAEARMIPVSMAIESTTSNGAPTTVQRKVEIVDLPALTSSAVLVSVYQTLLQTNQSSVKSSYHVTGSIAVAGLPPVPIDVWGTPGDTMASQLAAALAVSNSFTQLYANPTRTERIESVNLRVKTIPSDLRVELESVRLVSSSIVHAGDRVTVEATLRPWEKAARNVRLDFTVPARIEPGMLRIMVGSSAALDRSIAGSAEAPRTGINEADLTAVAARIRAQHAADQLYLSLLLPESQASVAGQTLDSLPLSMANSLESPSSGVEAGLHGESLVVRGQIPAGGVLNGQQILSLRVEAGGGLH